MYYYEAITISNMEAKRTERIIILEEFIRKTTDSYQKIINGIMDMSPELGKKIPLTDKLTNFRDAIIHLVDINEYDINLALIGFALDAMTRERRETFMSSLQRLIAATDDVLVMDTYKAHASYFVKVKNASRELLSTVDQFSDIVRKKYFIRREIENYIFYQI